MSDLDGATDPGPENAYPADAGQFAARWNEWDPERRESWLRKLTRLDQQRMKCRDEDHEGDIEFLELERRRDHREHEALTAERDALAARVAAVETFASSRAVAAHAVGDGTRERTWLDLLIVIERATGTDATPDIEPPTPEEEATEHGW